MHLRGGLVETSWNEVKTGSCAMLWDQSEYNICMAARTRVFGKLIPDKQNFLRTYLEATSILYYVIDIRVDEKYV